MLLLYHGVLLLYHGVLGVVEIRCIRVDYSPGVPGRCAPEVFHANVPANLSYPNLTKLFPKVRQNDRLVGGSAEHIRALDGVRGLAIVMVMGAHFWLGAKPRNPLEHGIYTFFENGQTGVDLFFVLSGFLITGILLDAKGATGYFRNFYARRFLRIFPVYYGFLFLYFVVTPVLIDSDPAGPFAVGRGTEIWFWTYTSNFLSLVKGAQIPPGLNHFWSLAVEEQFYLIWPAVVMLTSPAKLKKLCLAIVVAAFAFRWGLRFTDYYQTGAVVLTPARIDTLAIGAWLAVMIRERDTREFVERWAVPTLITCGAVLALMNFPEINHLARFYLEMQTIGFPLLAALSASLIVLTTSARRKHRRIRSVFEAQPLPFFGKYSYTMYVVHLPLVIAMNRFGFGISSLPRAANSDVPAAMVFTIIAGATTVLIAYLSWNVYEKRFLKLKRFFPLPSSGVAGFERIPATSQPLSNGPEDIAADSAVGVPGVVREGM